MLIEIITYTLIACVIAAMLLVPVEFAQEYIQGYRKYKQRRRDLELAIRVWASIAKSCDPVEEAFDKGYAIARLVIYYHELEELEIERNEYLCS